jgi:hypothetical protein
LFEMAEVIFSETPRRMQERIIWINCEADVGCAKALDRMVSTGQIKALRGIGPSFFCGDGDGSVGQADHFGVVVDTRFRPTKALSNK